MSDQDIYNDKKVWGPRYWTVMHGVAEHFKDGNSFATTINTITDAVPCTECYEHATTFLKENPPSKVKDKAGALRYVCNYHNSASKYAGNPQRDCEEYVKSVMDSDTTAGNPNQVTEIGGESTVKDPLLQAKQSKIDLFNSYCDKDKIERPQIFQQPCPVDKTTSCVTYTKPDDVKVYLNPYTDSDRQILHEYQHYRALKQGGRQSSEHEAQNFAYSEINRIAPQLKDTYEKADLKRMGIWGKEKTIDAELKGIDRIARDKNTLPQATTEVRMEKEFPLYYMIRAEEERRRREEEKEKKQIEGGMINAIVPVYEAYGKMIGLGEVPPAQLALAHAPQLIENVVMTLVEANFSPAGSALGSLLMGGIFFAAGIVGRKRFVLSDQLLIQNLSASFFWRTLEFLNPKRGVKDSFKDAFDELKDGNYSPSIWIETPTDEMKKKQMDAKRRLMALQAKAAQTTVPGGVPVVAGDGSGNPPSPFQTQPITTSTAIGTTTEMDPAEFDLTGETYYDDADSYTQASGPGSINMGVERSVYTGQPTGSTYADESGNEYDVQPGY